jgi:OOP family OmpA-OmpF porin
LTNFTGDAGPFQSAQTHLESCLQVHYEAPPRPSALKLWIVAGAILLALSWWGVTGYQTHARWSNLLAELRSEPGIVITMAGKTWGGYHLEGLRDPSAKDPSIKIAEVGLEPAMITAVWSPYYSLEPTLVEARAQSILRPPKTVHLSVEGQTLVAIGSAPAEWAKETRRLAVLVPGISHYRDQELITTTLPELLDRINRTVIHFSAGSSSVEPAERATLGRISDALRDLALAASESGQRLQLEILGGADETGPVSRNIQLSKERAEVVLSALGVNQLSGAPRVITGVMPSRPQLEAQNESSGKRIVILHASLVTVEQGNEAVRP